MKKFERCLFADSVRKVRRDPTVTLKKNFLRILPDKIQNTSRKLWSCIKILRLALCSYPDLARSKNSMESPSVRLFFLDTPLCHWITIKAEIMIAYALTPWNVRVSSKHVLSNFYDGNCIPFPITPSVEGAGRPAVRGGTVTQHPSRMTSNGRFQKLLEFAFINQIAC